MDQAKAFIDFIDNLNWQAVGLQTEKPENLQFLFGGFTVLRKMFEEYDQGWNKKITPDLIQCK